MLTTNEVRMMREEYATGRLDIKEIAKKYDVSTRSARNAIRGDTFFNLPGAVPTDSRRISPSVRKDIEKEIKKEDYRGKVKFIMETFDISYELYRGIKDSIEESDE